VTGMLRAGYEVVLTHGNGPQVGAVLIQNELGSRQVPPMPMDVCGAETQGFIGYMFCQSLRNIMAERGISGHPPVCVVTQVEVDPRDPAFFHPTKPVGPFFTEEEARRRMELSGESWIEDAGRGWRRVVPSPDPKGIVESDVIRGLVDRGAVVIASGGGGIPVVRRDDGLLQGVEAVIDKDLAGERLAQQVNAQAFVILTDVPNVCVHYGKPYEQKLGEITAGELRRLAAEGHFRSGSMGPKVEAALRFVENGGAFALIANLEQAVEALKGSAGTRIVKG
jgi:carbamate kinase